MYACLAVTCQLHFWQNDRDFLRATVVTRGWNGYRNKSQHRKSTLEKKILPPFQQGFEPATFQSQVRCSNHWAIPAPKQVKIGQCSCMMDEVKCGLCSHVAWPTLGGQGMPLRDRYSQAWLLCTVAWPALLLGNMVDVSVLSSHIWLSGQCLCWAAFLTGHNRLSCGLLTQGLSLLLLSDFRKRDFYLFAHWLWQLLWAFEILTVF